MEVVVAAVGTVWLVVILMVLLCRARALHGCRDRFYGEQSGPLPGSQKR